MGQLICGNNAHFHNKNVPGTQNIIQHTTKIKALCIGNASMLTANYSHNWILQLRVSLYLSVHVR